MNRLTSRVIRLEDAAPNGWRAWWRVPVRHWPDHALLQVQRFQRGAMNLHHRRGCRRFFGRQLPLGHRGDERGRRGGEVGGALDGRQVERRRPALPLRPNTTENQRPGAGVAGHRALHHRAEHVRRLALRQRVQRQRGAVARAGAGAARVAGLARLERAPALLGRAIGSGIAHASISKVGCGPVPRKPRRSPSRASRCRSGGVGLRSRRRPRRPARRQFPPVRGPTPDRGRPGCRRAPRPLRPGGAKGYARRRSPARC